MNCCEKLLWYVIIPILVIVIVLFAIKASGSYEQQNPCPKQDYLDYYLSPPPRPTFNYNHIPDIWLQDYDVDGHIIDGIGDKTNSTYQQV